MELEWAGGNSARAACYETVIVPVTLISIDARITSPLDALGSHFVTYPEYEYTTGVEKGYVVLKPASVPAKFACCACSVAVSVDFHTMSNENVPPSLSPATYSLNPPLESKLVTSIRSVLTPGPVNPSIWAMALYTVVVPDCMEIVAPWDEVPEVAIGILPFCRSRGAKTIGQSADKIMIPDVPKSRLRVYPDPPSAAPEGAGKTIIFAVELAVLH